MKYIQIILFFLILSAASYSQSNYGSELSGTIALPTGVNSEFLNTGYGAMGGFYYQMESEWRFGLLFGFIRSRISSDEVNKYYQTLGQPGSVDIDGTVSIIPIVLSFRYVFPGPTARFYAIMEAGLYSYWTKADANLIYEDGGSTPYEQNEFSSEVGGALGFGVLYPLSKELSLDASFRYHFIRNLETIRVNDNTEEEYVGSNNFLNFGLGVNWYFNI